MKANRLFNLGVLALLVLPVCFLNACAPQDNIQIALGGDIMLARRGEPIFDGSSAFGNTRQLFQQADIALANLESPLSKSGLPIGSQVLYNLCSPPEGEKILEGVGIQYFSIINNHTDDCGLSGVQATEKLLRDAGLHAVTTSLKEITVEDQRIGMIAGEDVTAGLNLEQMVAQIHIAKEKGDFVIVSLHWGMEYQAGPTQRQREIATALAEAGADLLWGHHPHVLQPMEWMTNQAGDHRTLVIYSLGNLLSDQAMLRDAQRTAIVTIQLTGGEITGIRVDPYVMESWKYPLIPAEGDEAELILERLDYSDVMEGLLIPGNGS